MKPLKKRKSKQVQDTRLAWKLTDANGNDVPLATAGEGWGWTVLADGKFVRHGRAKNKRNSK